MFKNHLLVAWRQIKKQGFYSLLNILGLSLGVGCCLLITLFVLDEKSYDQHHQNFEQLYRVVLDINMNESEGLVNALPPPMAKTLVEEIPEIEDAARLNPFFDNAGSSLIRKETEQENQYEDGFVYADQSFFSLFDLPLIYGNKKNLLTKPNTLVITKKMANKYFSGQNPVGQLMILNDRQNQTFEITGVIEDIPAQSHFHFDFFMSMPSLRDSESNEWLFNNYFAYVKLKEGASLASLEQKLRAFSLKHLGPSLKENLDFDLNTAEANGQSYFVTLQALEDIHLHSDGYFPQLEANGDIRYVRLFGAIAIFILLIAMVNFVNLSTARSANRAKEVGLRKVMGARQFELIGQFLTESILIAWISFGIGAILAQLMLPFFNDISGKTLGIPYETLGFLTVFLLAATLIGLIAGLYPAFYLSAFKPIKVLKGQLRRGSKSGHLRSVLVIVQFAISMALIVGTFVVYLQLAYIQNKKLGFDKEQVMLIQDTYTISDQLNAFKESLKQLPEVDYVTTTAYLPLDGGMRNSVSFYPAAEVSAQNQVPIQYWSVDEDYLDALGIQLKAGRNFAADRPSDQDAIILNESAVEFLSLKDPIGKKIRSPFIEGSKTVIGIVENFNFESLKNEIQGLGLVYHHNPVTVALKVNTSNMEQLLGKVASVWNKFAPNQALRYEFMDDRFAQMYKLEDRVGKLSSIFSILAIVIACLGLLALATFLTEQRTKEIGIRKVLGASNSHIVFQLSKGFLIPVIIGILIAIPLAWREMDKWLANFAYSIEIKWYFFVIAGLIALGIAFLTVGAQSLRAALNNPTQSLRSE